MHRLYLYLGLLFLLSITACEQDTPPKQPLQEESVSEKVDKMPHYPGGQEKMMQFIRDSLQYPEKAKEEGIEGMVVLDFVVDKKGHIKDIKVLRSLGGGCDQAAKKVVKAMPNWKPATKDGQPVAIHFKLPFRFELDEEHK